jgi:hypothetical protein
MINVNCIKEHITKNKVSLGLMVKVYFIDCAEVVNCTYDKHRSRSRLYIAVYTTFKKVLSGE